MAVAGQTINDRILAARHSIAGQGLAKAVCKATTEEVIGPKKKHLDYLMLCTNEPNVSIPTLANLLIERTQNPHWVVVFKGLITTHHLMCYGNERFTQYLASSNSNFQLANFLDKSGVQGYDMSPFIRRYAKYLSEKSVSYRTVAFDFCKVKRGKDGGMLRTMNSDKLLKTLPVVQQQLDALVEFECTAQDLNNGVINAAFMLLFRDLIRLFACYNDGIINLLEKYFEMNKKQARDALDLYKRFLIRMDRVMEFLKVAESVGIEKSDIPDLAKAPSSLLEALEGHLASLEGRKPGSGGTTPTGNTRINVAAAVSTLSSTSTAFGTAATNGGGIDERTAQKLLEEEAAAMEKFRSTATASNPFAAPAAAAPEPAKEETPNILDLFGVASPPPMAATSGSSSSDANRASEDLLQLAGNPFANMLNAAGSGAPFPPLAATATPQQQLFMSPNAGYGGMAADFSSVFGPPAATGSGSLVGGPSLFGEVLQPANKPASANTNTKVITGDLDSSLANLASNLSFGSAKKSVITGPTRGPPMAQPGSGFNPFPQQQQMGGPLQPSTSASSFLSPQYSSHHESHLLIPQQASSTFLSSPAGPFPPGLSPGNSLSPVMAASYSFPPGHGATPRPASFIGLSPSGAFPTDVSLNNNNNSLFYSPNAAFISSPASSLGDDPRSQMKRQQQQQQDVLGSLL